jgi:hypothetical protein
MSEELIAKGEKFQDFLNRREEIDNWLRWFAQLPSCYLIASEKITTTKALTEIIQDFARKEGSFLVIKLSGGERNGWLNKQIWEFMRTGEIED